MYYLYSFLNFIEEKEMKKIFLLSILVFATGSIFADGHTADEKEVMNTLFTMDDAPKGGCKHGRNHEHVAYCSGTAVHCVRCAAVLEGPAALKERFPPPSQSYFCANSITPSL